MRDTLSIAKLRANLAGTVRQVHSAGIRIGIQKDGHTLAALVPPCDLQILEAIEDRLDLLDSLDALTDYRTKGGLPLEDVKRDLCP